jgi:hypothetical protein
MPMQMLLWQQQGTGMQAARWTAMHITQHMLRLGMLLGRDSTGRVMLTGQLMATLLQLLLQRAQHTTLLQLQLPLQACCQRRQQ